MTTKSPRVFVYARFSSDLQSPLSVRDQFDACAKYAQKQGWEITQQFSDHAKSGSTDQRHGFKKMREAVTRGECDIVLLESLDRLSRDPEHTARFYKEAQFQDVKVYTIDQGKIGIIQLGFSSTFGALYLEMLADKTRRGLSGRISDGKSAGGISYGYKVPRDILDQPIKGELYIDPTEAAIIKRIFREYAEGRSPLKIAAGLNEDGIPAPSGAGKDAAHWRQNTINGNKERGTGILNNELYIGRRIWNRLNYRKDPTTGRRVSRLNPQSEWSISEVLELRIVDEKLWELVKERQASHAEIRKTADNQDRNGLSSSQRLRRKKFLLSGLPRCGKCGAPLTVAAARYYCSTTKEKGKSICSGIPGLNRPRIEAHVLNQFRNHLMTDSAYKQFKTAYTKQLKQQQQANADLEHIHNRTIAKLKKEAEHLLSAVRSRPSNELLLDELDKVSKQLKLAETQRDQVRQEAVPLPEDMPALYRGYVDNIVQMLSDESIVGRAADMLHDMINQIIVNYEEDSQSFRITLDGKIAQMLAGSNAEAAEAYLSSESSLKLVAGERSQIFYGLYRGASSNASTIQPYPAQTATS